jgi:hypothetical protein
MLTKKARMPVKKTRKSKKWVRRSKKRLARVSEKNEDRPILAGEKSL